MAWARRTFFNQAPSIGYDPTENSQADGMVTGDLNAVDVDDDPLTYSVTQDPEQGTVVVNPDGTFTYTPDADLAETGGEDSFTVKVSDTGFHLHDLFFGFFEPDFGHSTTKVVTLTVDPVNRAPVAVPDAVTTAEDNALLVTVLGNDTDPDGDALTVALGIAPVNGAVVLNADGSFTYTPGADFFGSDAFTYTVSDADGASSDPATVTVAVTAVNDAPNAADDSIGTDEDTAFDGTLPTGTDVDGDSLTYAIDQPPIHGAVVLNADGAYTYTPDGDFHGDDSFSYVVNDGTVDSAPVTVSITVGAVNDAPNAADDSIGTDEDTAVTIAVLANDTDPDGDALTVALGIAPVNGAVVLNADGSFTYTPGADFFGSDAFTYTVSDADGASSDPATVTVAITAVNDAPTAADDAIGTDEDTAFDGTLPTGTDVDGDSLTYAIDQLPTHGAVVLNADGAYTYTPDGDFHGDDSFSYVVNDGTVDSAPATVSVTINQGASTGVVIGSVTVDNPHGGPLTFVVTSAPTMGTVTVDSAGNYTYTPTMVARLIAGAGTTSVADTFTVTADDGLGTATPVTVSVPVDPAHQIVTSSITVDGVPYAVAVSPDGSRLYVANVGDNTVSVIDTTTNTILGTPIGVGSTPLAVAVSPDGSRVYVANAADNTVSVIDTTTNTVLGTPIAFDVLPTAVAVGPDGDHLYVVGVDTATYAGSVTMIDTATNTVVGSPIPVGTASQGIAVGRDGSRVYVTNTGGNTVSVIDTTTNMVVGAPIPVGAMPTAIAVGPDASRVYVTNAGDNTVSVIDTTTNMVVGAPISVGAKPAAIAVGPQNALVYVSNAAGDTVSVIDATTNTVVGDPIVVGDNPVALAVSPGGSHVYIVNADPTVSTISLVTETGAPVVNPNPPAAPNLATGAVTGSVTSTDPDGTALTYTVAQPPAWGTVVINPNGTYTYTPASTARLTSAAFAASLTDTFTVNATDSTGAATPITVTVPVIPALSDITSPMLLASLPGVVSPVQSVAISPDSSRLYLPTTTFIADGTPAGAVAVIDTATGLTVATIPVGEGLTGAATLSPNGGRVYVTTTIVTAGGSPLNGAVAVIDADTNTTIATIPVGSGQPTGIAVSPDGRRVYVSTLSTTADSSTGAIAVIDTATNTTIATIAAEYGFGSLTVSPDSRRVYALIGDTNADGSLAMRVAVIDAATNTVITTIPAGVPTVGTRRMAVSLDNSRLYIPIVTRTGNGGALGAVLVVDTQTNTAITSIPVGLKTSDVVVSPDGSRVYANSVSFGTDVGANDVVVIDTATNTTLGVIPIAGGASTLAFSGDGRRLYAVANGVDIGAPTPSSAVTVIDTTRDMTLGDPILLGQLTHFTTVSPDGRRVYAPLGFGLAVISTATSNQSGGPGPHIGPSGLVPGHFNEFGMFVPDIDSSPGGDQNEPPDGTESETPAASLTASDLLNNIPDTYDTIRIDKVVDDGTTRMVVYMSGVSDNILSGSGWAALLSIGGKQTDPNMAWYIDTYEELWHPDEILLVGFSKGGMTAQNYAVAGKHADKVTLVVTFASPAVRSADEYRADAPGEPGTHVLNVWATNDWLPSTLSRDDALGSYSQDDESGNSRGILRVTASWKNGVAAHSKENYSKATALFDAAAQQPDSYLAELGDDINRFAGAVGQSTTVQIR